MTICKLDQRLLLVLWAGLLECSGIGALASAGRQHPLHPWSGTTGRNPHLDWYKRRLVDVQLHMAFQTPDSNVCGNLLRHSVVAEG